MPDNRVKCDKCGYHYFKPGICAVCKPPKLKTNDRKPRQPTKGSKQSKGQKKKGKRS